jgi:thymidine kinase
MNKSYSKYHLMPKKIFQSGRLEVICGSMFSGKSEELIRRMKRALYSQPLVQIFKHSFDNRSSLTHIHTHNGNKINAIPVSNLTELKDLILPETLVIGIDEIQFFDKDIILLIHELVSQGKRVVIAGLDLDFRGLPFGNMPYLLALADDVLKLKAICMKTGEEAHFSQRLINNKPANHNDPIILIGATDYYEARSRAAYEIDYIPLKEFLSHKNI